MNSTRKSVKPLVARVQFFSGAEPEQLKSFVMPEDLNMFSIEGLLALRAEAAAEFDTLYGEGQSLSTDDLEILGVLTDSIEALSAQIEIFTSNQSDAAAFVARRASFNNHMDSDKDEEYEDDDEEDEKMMTGHEKTKFSSKTQVRLKARGGQAARQAAVVASMAQRSDMKDVTFAVGEGLGVPKGSGANFESLGQALDHRLKSFNLTAYQSAAGANRDVRELQSFASIKLPISDDLVIRSADKAHVSEVLHRAVTTEGKNALLASGGWFAPSEVLYTQFLELETTEGLLTTPEVGISRGGAQITPGISFKDIYAAVGFSYSETEDIAGAYQDNASGANTAGDKPSYKVVAPDFTNYRLAISGLIIEAGLLAYRGYPEHFADVIRKSLVAHAHKINAEFIAKVVAGSTAVSMTAGQVGSAAPILRAVELQAEHMRATHRMGLTATLECKIPHWVKGAIRSDLAVRTGVDLVSVSDGRIRQWFADRFIAVEFVYDWQPIETTAAASFTAWPSTVDFLLYPAGTWIKGRSEVLTIDTLYDSTLLANNDFTALFTEEGWLAAKVGSDSRKITCSINSNGSTKLGVDIKNTGAV